MRGLHVFIPPLCLVVFIISDLNAQQQVLETSWGSVVVQEDPFNLIIQDREGLALVAGVDPHSYPAAIFGLKVGETWDRIITIESAKRESGTLILTGVTAADRAVQISISKPAEHVLVQMSGPENAEAIGYAIHADDGEHFRGMGQRFTGLELRGQEIPTNDPPWTVPIPFLISSRGYGLYAETIGQFTFDLGTRESEVYSFWVNGPQLAFHLFYGPTPKEIVRQYTALTGRMLKPPAWKFGVWKWRDWVFDEYEVYQDATMLRDLDIPTSVIFIDSPWSNEYIDYEFNPKLFPNPGKMIADLHAMGYRVLLWMVPFVNPAAKNYRYADRKGYFVKDANGDTYQIEWWRPSGTDEIGLTSDGRGGMIDFTNPKAVKWWQNQVAKVVDLGIDGFKMDDCEHLPADAYLFDGTRGYEHQHHYPELYDKAVHDLMQDKTGGDFVLIPRAGSAGSQRYIPAFWAADQNADFDMNEGLPSVIRGAQSIGLMG
ncbi:MAG: TIM-barrel domain-containing protein, partial [Candidatus Neomarinimicrobiota bacterium]